jgi:hypothetical protein
MSQPKRLAAEFLDFCPHHQPPRAATLAPKRGLLADRLTGDGLVPLNSALGQHDEPARRLRFARESQHIAYRTGHLDLLSSPTVAAQLLAWLHTAPDPGP